MKGSVKAMATVARQLDRHAATYGGVIAALSFTTFEVIASAYAGAPGTATTPLRMIGATVLGRHALDPHYPLVPVALTGLVLVLALAVFFSNVFVGIVTRLSAVTDGEFLASPVQQACAGMVFGIIVWLFIFYGVAPVVGWSWFPASVHTDVALAAYALFFGVPVGWFSVRQDANHPHAEPHHAVAAAYLPGVDRGRISSEALINALPRVLIVLTFAMFVAFWMWLLAMYIGIEYMQPSWDANSFPAPRLY
jgi:hypothetical protein